MFRIVRANRLLCSALTSMVSPDPYGGKRLPADIAHVESLSQDAFDLVKDRAASIGPVTDLPALDSMDDDGAIRQVYQLALYSPRPAPTASSTCFRLERAINPPVEECQDRLPGFAEKTSAQWPIIHSCYLTRMLSYP